MELGPIGTRIIPQSDIIDGSLSLCQLTKQACDKGPQLVPDASSSMMRNKIQGGHLMLFYRIVQEKVYQDGIDSGIGIFENDFPPYKLHTPYTTTTQLYLPRVSACEFFELSNMIVEWWTVLKTSK